MVLVSKETSHVFSMFSRTRLLLLLLVVGGVESGLSSQYLYDGDGNAGPVIEYKGDNDGTTSEIFQASKTPRIVEFYSPYCGACRSFKSKYINLALEVTSTVPDVEFYAVSCAAHQKVCAEFAVNSYPTLVALKSDTAPKEEAVRVKRGLVGGYTPNSIIDALDMEGEKLKLTEDGDDSVSPTTEMKKVQRTESESKSVTYNTSRKTLEDYHSDDADDEEGASDKDEDEDNGGNHGKSSEDGDGNTGFVDTDNESEEDKDSDTEGISDDEDERTHSKPYETDKFSVPKNLRATGVKERTKMEELKYRMKTLQETEEDNKDEDSDENNDVDDSKSGEDEKKLRVTDGKRTKMEELKYRKKTREEKGQKDEDSDEGDSIEDEKPEEDEESDKDDSDDETASKESGETIASDDVSKDRAPSTSKAGASATGAIATTTTGAAQGKTTMNGGAGMNVYQTIPQPKPGADVDQWKDYFAKVREEKLKKEKRFKLIPSGKKYGKETGTTTVRKPNAPERNGATKTMLQYTPGTEGFNKKKIEEEAKMKKVHLTTQTQTKGQQKRLFNRFRHRSAEEILLNDASLSFVSGLVRGVFNSRGPLVAQRKNALKNWLDLLSISLPQEWGIHALVDDLRSNIDFVSQSSGQMNMIMSKHRLPDKEWSKECSKGMPGQGFSCGFWKLLHIMSVGIAEYRGGLNLVKSGSVKGDTRTFSTREAGDVLREYMSYFFGCDECRTNFVADYDHCIYAGCSQLSNQKEEATPESWKQFALYLWEMHNRVTTLQVGKVMQRKKSFGDNKQVLNENQAKSMWPRMGSCFECFKEDGSWDKDVVFEYLEKVYWSRTEKDTEVERMLDYGDDEVAGSGLVFYLTLVSILFAAWLVKRNKIAVSGLHKKFDAMAPSIRGRKVRSV